MYLTIMKLDDTVYLSESFRTTMNVICSRLGIDTSTEWWNSGAGIRLTGHVIEYFVHCKWANDYMGYRYGDKGVGSYWGKNGVTA